MDECSPVQNRRYDRSNVLLKATLEVPGDSLTVVLRNLSQEGALVQSEALPEEGVRILFHRQGLSVPGRIAWTSGDQAGIEFDFPLFPRELLRHVPMPERRPELPSAKRPGLGARPLTHGEQVLVEQWGNEGPNKLGE